MCDDLGIGNSPQVIWRSNALSSSGGYKVYDEECIVEYNRDLWTKRGGVIRILCFYGQQCELIIALIFQVVLVPLYTCQN